MISPRDPKQDDSSSLAGAIGDSPGLPLPLGQIRREQIAAFDERQRLLYLWLVDWSTKNDIARTALKVGDPSPDFLLPDERGRLVWSRELLVRGPVVLSFFRGSWCPFCVSELKALDAAAPIFESLGATLIAVTPETAGLPRELKRLERLNLAILSDVDYGLGQDFGVIYTVPPYIRAEFLELGLDLAARHGSSACMLPIPATYVIDHAGRIAASFVDNDFTIRTDPDSIVEELRRLGSKSAAVDS